ncbi:iron complex transport system permease protein [Methylobacillus rhizosphaerae]|uniref:Iron complex transport system permease protein n=1 Tax=Methylobacillus rhizosphaerae TaxID=551994 RepID=A0A238YYK9_9PROT|nr:iron ABC transporter permease [Methylobacillus rhizosphaerae]SNR75764.1 iron complex transport system permease protein [Methylobacillus rhizosphaerae]
MSDTTKLVERYAHTVRRRLLLLLALFLALVSVLLLDLATGPAGLPLSTLAQALYAPASLDAGTRVILWDIRMPYALMAVLVGAALGVSGAQMQTVLNNPLASPFTLGLAAAATAGASLAIVTGFTAWGAGASIALPLGAFAGAVIAALLIHLLAWRTGASVTVVILFGIALMFCFESLLWLLQYLADSNALQQIVFWSMGSLGRATWSKIAVLAVVLLVCGLWTQAHAWQLTVLRSGEDHARSSGVAVERLRLISLLRVCLMSATALAFVGTIGFVGLVGPHMARLMIGEDHRFYLPASALAGALMLSFASILSKVLVPGVVLPVGILTALIGVPVFMLLIWRHYARWRA